MANSILISVVNAGLNHELPLYLQRKIQPTNTITLLLLFVIAIPFVFITLFFLPKELAIFPALGAIICVIVLFVNHYGGIYYSRLIISMLPISLGAIYNAYLSGENEGPLPSLYLIELSFALIPFVIFDLKERGFLFVTSIFCLLVIVSFPINKNWFNIETDSSILRDGWLSTVTIFLAVFCELGCVSGLAFLNKQSERHSENLLKGMDEKNAVLKNSELQLIENLKKVEQAQQDEQKRNWATEGVAKFSSILRSHDNNTIVFDHIIAQLAVYLKANQGGLYVVQNPNGKREEISIKLAAFYAYSRKKYLEGEYAAGQGLIGQAYLEKEYIYITDVPADYIKITSGLGEATPTSILIVPLIMNEVVEGMIEIASFHRFEAHEIQFIEKIGENIAAYIQNNRISENTSKLLAESQRQAEELKAQEEEMRQNLEELAATQEEMTRKEYEYIKQIEALKELLLAGEQLQEKEKELRRKIAELEAEQQEMAKKEKAYLGQLKRLEQMLANKESNDEEVAIS